MEQKNLILIYMDEFLSIIYPEIISEREKKEINDIYLNNFIKNYPYDNLQLNKILDEYEHQKISNRFLRNGGL